MKQFTIYFRNGKTLNIKAHYVEKDATGYMVCEKPNCGIASFYHLSNTRVSDVKELPHRYYRNPSWVNNVKEVL